ncbi:MAG: hypothetical protein M3Z24_04785, partial [Chloroflexota bacterium]|nr:hypothetical protein [Chloroflexota bacterium]
ALILIALIVFAPSLIRGAGNAQLTSANNSGAQGTAQIFPNASGKGAVLQISLSNLNPHTDYYVTLDQNSCAGNTLLDAGRLTTDSNGSAFTELPLSNVNTIVQQNTSPWLDVHQSSSSGVSVACGTVQVNDAVYSQVNTPGTVDLNAGVTPVSGNGNTSSSVPSGLNNTNSSSGGGFPNTGVAPGKGNSYDNSTFPRKY